jgi:hypothetical protein
MAAAGVMITILFLTTIFREKMTDISLFFQRLWGREEVLDVRVGEGEGLVGSADPQVCMAG